MQKPRILILACGGTITMVDKPGPGGKSVRVPADDIMQILRNVPSLGEMAECTFVKLFHKDSTNMNPADWVVMGRSVAEAAMSNKFDGIVITHGTDTMAYTATALGLTLADGLSVPVIITGSQKPLLQHGSDARVNLERAVMTAIDAANHHYAEVMVLFDHRILRGTRTVKADEKKFDAFASPAFPDLGEHSGAGIKWKEAIRRASKHGKIDLTKIRFSKGVLVIDLVPGLEPGIIIGALRQGNVHALILRSQGAGNVPTDGEYSMIPVIEEATKLGIPVMISTKFVGGTTMSDVYETGAAAITAGAIPTGDLTDVAVQVKAMWLMSLGLTTGKKLGLALLKATAGEVSSHGSSDKEEVSA